MYQSVAKGKKDTGRGAIWEYVSAILHKDIKQISLICLWVSCDSDISIYCFYSNVYGNNGLSPIE